MPDDRFLHRRAGRSQKVNTLTDLEYRVWTQYVLSADDFGVMRATHYQLQADNDNLATRPARVIQRCVDALVKCDLVRWFQHQGKPYVYQHDWQTWQKVAYPRTTTQPQPPVEALANCDAATQRLFLLHPGGSGRTRKESSENIPETFQEDSALIRAGAPAKRLTANGERLTAFPMDTWFDELKAHYPANRVSSGHLTMTAFVNALLEASDGPVSAWARMRGNLDNQKRGHEWAVKGMAPRLEKWLREGLWEQRHEAQPASARPGFERKEASSEAWICPHVKPCDGPRQCHGALEVDPQGKQWPLKPAVSA